MKNHHLKLPSEKMDSAEVQTPSTDGNRPNEESSSSDINQTPPRTPPPAGSTTTTAGSSIRTELVVTNEDRERVSAQIRRLTIASGGSLAVFVVSVIPLPIVAGMLVVLSTFMALFYKLYERALVEYQIILQGQGFGQFLPDSIYDQLVNMSFHEWMVEGTFVQEWSFLMLYMMPGITREQIEAYIDRLIPRHRQLVRRRGLGYFLGETFMRHIVGDRNNMIIRPISDQAVSSSPEAAPVVVPRRLTLENEQEEDEASELDPNDADQYARFLGFGTNETTTPRFSESDTPAGTNMTTSTVATSEDDETTSDNQAGANPEKNNNNERNDDLAGEFSLVTDAFFTSLTYYYGMAYDMALNSMSSISRSYLFRASLAVTVASLGVGAFGIYSGTYSPRDFSRSFQDFTRSFQQGFGGVRPSYPSPSILLSSALASGGTATIMLMFGFRRQRDS
jgi:hypothetical protein